MGNVGQRVKALRFPLSLLPTISSTAPGYLFSETSLDLFFRALVTIQNDQVPFLLKVWTLPLPPQFDELCESWAFISEGSSPSCGPYGLQGFTEPWEWWKELGSYRNTAYRDETGQPEPGFWKLPVQDQLREGRVFIHLKCLDGG